MTLVGLPAENHPQQVGVRGALGRVKPTFPDSAVFKALSSLSREELEDEIQSAEQLSLAVATYLDWLRLTTQLRATLDVASPTPPRVKVVRA